MRLRSVGIPLAAAIVSMAHSSRAQEIVLKGPLAPEPSYEPSANDEVRLDGGMLGPMVGIVLGDSVEAIGGAGARIAVSIRVARPWWLETDLFGAFMANEGSQVLQTGTDVILRVQLKQFLAFGAGLTAGYLSASGSDYLEPTPFFGPVLVPWSLWLGGMHAELRIPVLFGSARLDHVDALRPILIAPQLSLTFSGAVVPPTATIDGGRSRH